LKFTAKVTDSGKSSGIRLDKFALTLYKNGGLYKSVPDSLLQGGNVVVHIK
jgi:hypothetical protein